MKKILTSMLALTMLIGCNSNSKENNLKEINNAISKTFNEKIEYKLEATYSIGENTETIVANVKQNGERHYMTIEMQGDTLEIFLLDNTIYYKELSGDFLIKGPNLNEYIDDNNEAVTKLPDNLNELIDDNNIIKSIVKTDLNENDEKLKSYKLTVDVEKTMNTFKEIITFMGTQDFSLNSDESQTLDNSVIQAYAETFSTMIKLNDINAKFNINKDGYIKTIDFNFDSEIVSQNFKLNMKLTVISVDADVSIPQIDTSLAIDMNELQALTELGTYE